MASEKNTVGLVLPKLPPARLGHDDVMLWLIVSIGDWSSQSEEDRGRPEWVLLCAWPSERGWGLDMSFERTEPSSNAASRILGRYLEPEEARKHALREEFFAVSDYVFDNDPAVSSYISGEETDASRTRVQ